MTSSRGNDTTEKEGAGRLPHDADRIMVVLIPKAEDDLKQLQARTSLSRTDLVNRAITLYEFVDSQLRAGRDLLIRDQKTGQLQSVLIR